MFDVDTSQLLIVDVQERLMPAMSRRAAFSDSLRILIEAAVILQIPICVSEQYVKGLGSSISMVNETVSGAKVLEKFDFSCADDVAIRGHIQGVSEREGRTTLVVVGIEAHICVFLSAMGFKDLGFRICVVDEAITSRDDRDAESARSALRVAGIDVVPLETLLFSWCGSSRHEQFREISRLVRERVR